MKVMIIILLLEAVLFARTALMIDVSSSMDTNGNKEKIEQVIKKYRSSHEHDVYTFSNSVTKVDSSYNITFGGGTSISNAIKHISLQKDITLMFLLTDGQPSSKQATLNAFDESKKRLKICTIFLSNNSTIPQVLDDISSKVFSVYQIDQAFENCERVKYKMLNELIIENKEQEAFLQNLLTNDQQGIIGY